MGRVLFSHSLARRCFRRSVPPVARLTPANMPTGGSVDSRVTSDTLPAGARTGWGDSQDCTLCSVPAVKVRESCRQTTGRNRPAPWLAMSLT